MTENEMAGWHHQLNGHEFEQALGVGDGLVLGSSPGGSREFIVRMALARKDLFVY